MTKKAKMPKSVQRYMAESTDETAQTTWYRVESLDKRTKEIDWCVENDCIGSLYTARVLADRIRGRGYTTRITRVISRYEQVEVATP
jgi:hypothetical protein